MKERFLLYRHGNPTSHPQGDSDATPESREIKGTREDLYALADDCGDGICKIPEKKPREGGEKVGEDPNWPTVSIKEINEKAKPGHIVIVGASWCKACKEAKRVVLKNYPNAIRHYVDYDEDDKAVVKNFPAVANGLPGVYGCSGPKQYEKLDWKKEA
ncbi:MAG: thioredoxin family protein [bacterium]|nr:thioredoxin family protein [bacterium]